MAVRFAIGSLVLALLFSAAGCVHPARTAEPQLTRAEAIGIAEATAQHAGYDLQKYNMTGCDYESLHRDHTWTVSFALKPPGRPGGHFLVWVDDWTEKAVLMPGE